MQTYERIPIIRLWQILLVPLQGEVTDSLAEKLTSEILHRVHLEEVTGLVIDVTGLWLVDSHLCAVISRIAEAAALMGARTFLSGMKPEVAMTLETMGIELRGASSTRSLDEALEALGVRLVTDRDESIEIDGVLDDVFDEAEESF
ncbi:MAG: STAS domain-containing protein [Polyangiaceae bacterium]|nr:STAS domain-containing protein [Polyangiaceae bacterium]